MDEIMKARDPSTCGPNYYEILGCDQSSSIEQIQAEFKHHALANHPDKNPESLQEARKLLKIQLVQPLSLITRTYSDCQMRSSS